MIKHARNNIKSNSECFYLLQNKSWFSFKLSYIEEIKYKKCTREDRTGEITPPNMIYQHFMKKIQLTIQTSKHKKYLDSFSKPKPDHVMVSLVCFRSGFNHFLNLIKCFQLFTKVN